jgi:hypothetical protein
MLVKGAAKDCDAGKAKLVGDVTDAPAGESQPFSGHGHAPALPVLARAAACMADEQVAQRPY